MPRIFVATGGRFGLYFQKFLLPKYHDLNKKTQG